MNSILQILTRHKIVPVIVLDAAEDILPLGEILIENGLPVAEITFRSSAAAEAVSLLKKKLPGICTGAGTLLDRDALKRAEDAGSDFFVSPGFNPKNAEYALEKNLVYIPGVSNPSLAEQAAEIGLTELKFFPAEAAGGTAMLKALHSVYPHISFMPTGGITGENILSYLSLPNVYACGGSWMVKKDLITGHKWDTITTLVREARSLIQLGK